LVEVTHSQKDSHDEVDCCLESVAIVLKKSKTIREWWSYYSFAP